MYMKKIVFFTLVFALLLCSTGCENALSQDKQMDHVYFALSEMPVVFTIEEPEIMSSVIKYLQPEEWQSADGYIAPAESMAYVKLFSSKPHAGYYTLTADGIVIFQAGEFLSEDVLKQRSLPEQGELHYLAEKEMSFISLFMVLYEQIEKAANITDLNIFTESLMNQSEIFVSFGYNPQTEFLREDFTAEQEQNYYELKNAIEMLIKDESFIEQNDEEASFFSDKIYITVFDDTSSISIFPLDRRITFSQYGFPQTYTFDDTSQEVLEEKVSQLIYLF